MIYFNATILEEETIWESIKQDFGYLDDGITVNFNNLLISSPREAINYLKAHLHKEERRWINWSKNEFIFNLDTFKEIFKKELPLLFKDDDVENAVDNEGLMKLEFDINPSKINMENLGGIIRVKPEFEEQRTAMTYGFSVSFTITYDDIMEAKNKRIFLSHKSADKPMVRDFKIMLRELGFDPWMDEDDLKAGDSLNKGILSGIQQSCAAIFFVTENYHDEKYLAAEIEHAIAEMTERPDFKIVTLIMAEDPSKIKVPSLLNRFVYKSPKSHLEALREILKALPLKLLPPVMQEN